MTGKPDEKTMKETQALGYILENYAEPAVYIKQRVLRKMKMDFLVSGSWMKCEKCVRFCYQNVIPLKLKDVVISACTVLYT